MYPVVLPNNEGEVLPKWSGRTRSQSLISAWIGLWVSQNVLLRESVGPMPKFMKRLYTSPNGIKLCLHVIC